MEERQEPSVIAYYTKSMNEDSRRRQRRVNTWSRWQAFLSLLIVLGSLAATAYILSLIQ